MMADQKLKEEQNRQMSEKFRLKAEKNEFKIETLTNILDQEEERRKANAAKMEVQLENYRKNLEYENKLNSVNEKRRQIQQQRQQQMQQMLENIENRVVQAEQARKDEINRYLENKNQMADLTQQNREKIEQEHKAKMDKLMKKLQDEEKNYENMKKELINMTKEKPLDQRPEDSKAKKLEKVKRECERRYQTRKENLLIKFHHNEEILKERQLKQQRETEELRKVNEIKQQRKEIVKQNYLNKLEKRRKELSKKLKIEQEKADAYAKQKEIILEHKYTNQVIDQMKVHYYKELYYNMKIQNKVGCEEFDKMAQNLKSIPEED